MTHRFPRLLILVLFLGLGSLAPNPLSAQGTGEFLCSLGSRDGQACESFDDCPGGVCVIAQGICPDAFICDCPSGTCSNNVLCSLDTSFGTCVGGVSPGLCCDVALNCLDNDPCVGAHKACVGGQDQGFSCLVDAHCRNGSCRSTGCFCDGGDFDAYTCVTTADCPGGGTCDCLASPTPVRTATPTNPPGVPTNTPVPGTATLTPTTAPGLTRTPIPTFTPRPTNTGVLFTPTPIPTNTPIIGVLAVVAADGLPGDDKLRLAADPRQLPVQGVVEIFGNVLPFTRRVSSPILDLQAEFGLPVSVPAGTTVHLIASTPTPGPSSVEYQASAEGCSLATGGSAGGGLVWLLFGAALLGLRRNRL